MPPDSSDTPTITSRHNSLVQEIIAIRDDRKSSLMVLEGPRLVREAVQSGKSLEILIWTKAAEFEPVFQAAHAKAKLKFQVSESVLKAVSDVETPQGILVVASRPQWSWQDILAKAPSPILILDGIQDPGNMATTVRTAEAAGAAGVVTVNEAAHLFSPKALRGAMGSTLRLPSLEHRSISEVKSELERASYILVAARMAANGNKQIVYTRFDWTRPVAILLGQEGQGLSPAWEPLVQNQVYIPMQSPVESLNVAAAAAILLYEARRTHS